MAEAKSVAVLTAELANEARKVEERRAAITASRATAADVADRGATWAEEAAIDATMLSVMVTWAAAKKRTPRDVSVEAEVARARAKEANVNAMKLRALAMETVTDEEAALAYQQKEV